MAKRQTKKVTNEKVETKPTQRITRNQIHTLAYNSLLRRHELIQSLLSPGRDIDTECHYPTSITKANYKSMYDRTGVASRVVEIYPDECWSQTPDVYEVEDATETEFEKAWAQLEVDHHILHYMNRIDTLSGIGQYGLLLFGIGDGKDLEKPVEGIDLKTGKRVGNKNFPLLYLRTYDESVIDIEEKEKDRNSPRYGYPTMYSINFEDTSSSSNYIMKKKVHWTRVVHIADNRTSSEIFGTPRMQKVYNNLLDLRKILGGSGEMFWKGGFPGIAFELGGDAGLTEVTDASKTAMRENIDDYFDGLDRALLLENVEAKPLNPQVADPSGHIEMQFKAISVALGVPYRIFQGSEEAKQASTQDKRVWNERIMKRQKKYLTPMLIRPIVDRLIAYGVLPEPAQYFVEWPDREAITDADIAAVAVKEVQAMKQYVEGGVAQILSPRDFFISILKKGPEEAQAFEDGVKAMEIEIVSDVKDQSEDDDDVADDNKE